MKTNIFISILIAVLLKANCITAQVLEQDSLALVAFYNSTGGPNWNNNSNWLTGPVSTWYKVTVEGDRVIELKFYSDNNLNGFISEEIGDLNELEKLVISNNPNLTGLLPDAIGQLMSLVGLGIGNCSLTGTIPNNIENCSCLEFLNLPQNNLTGPIPPEIGNLENLIFLDLHDNQLTGPIPPELGNCTNLWELELNNNQLTGKLPESIGSFFHNSIQGVNVILNVSNNLLTDSIPFSWADSAIMGGWLNFSGNLFTDIPPWNPNWILIGLKLEGNKMTFEDIEPHFVGYDFYTYSPQDSMGIKIDTTLIPDKDFCIYSGTGGEFTEYFWYKNGELILQSTEADTLFLENISYADTGIYYCYAYNSLASELTLMRRPVHINIDTGVNIVEHHKQEHISIYPNPAKDYVIFETSLNHPNGKKYKLILSDVFGQVVATLSLKNEKTVWDCREELSGTYIYSIKNGLNVIDRGKIVILK